MNWVNQKTLSDDQWTALHLACKQNSDIFLAILKLGADPLIRNKNGVSLMHKAAMDDNSYLITYLRDKLGFTISEADYDGNTPLHYACYNNSEYASFWLIGFGSDVNALNKIGDTPMHLLIKSVNKLYNTKTVRELIFKGARRDIKNGKGELPMALVDRIDDKKL